MLLEEEYYIGVPHLDAQHRALFKTMDRVKDILMKDDYERNKRLCKEAIKFLGDHASRHFSDEEAYMRSIHFANYELHKAQHDAIKENLLLFEQDIIASDYSPQSIKHLLGIMMAWLTYHTIEIDSVIGKEIPRIDCSNDAAVALEKAVVRISSELFRIVLTLANGNSRGFPLGQKIFCYTDCSHPDGRRVCILSALNKQVVLQAVSLLFSSRQAEVDELALSATEELSAMLAIHFVRNYQNGDFFHVDCVKILDENQLTETLPSHEPLCSLLFDSVYGAFLHRVWDFPD